jgi:hypothetical protein
LACPTVIERSERSERWEGSMRGGTWGVCQARMDVGSDARRRTDAVDADYCLT